MKIVFVLPGYPSVPIGGFRIVYQYANYLVNTGHEVSVVHAHKMRQTNVTPQGSLRFARSVWRNFLAWRSSVSPPNQQWQPVDERVRLVYLTGEPIARFIPDADAVFATAWTTAEYVNDYPRTKGEKFYLIQHLETFLGSDDEVNATWLMPFHKVVISKWLYDYGRAIGATNMKHIPNAIDNTHFRVTHSIESRRPSILTLYHRSKWKGVSDALESLELLHSKHPEVMTTMFGGVEKPNNIPDWIQYYQDPVAEQLVELYNSHSIYLGASWAEGWALPPAEAMSCGCAFVGTDIGGFRDYAINGQTALLSTPRDPTSLYENLLRVVEDDELRNRLQWSGNKHISTFTWENSGNALESYIEEVLH